MQSKTFSTQKHTNKNCTDAEPYYRSCNFDSRLKFFETSMIILMQGRRKQGTGGGAGGGGRGGGRGALPPILILRGRSVVRPP